jgi:hypothetical protein
MESTLSAVDTQNETNVATRARGTPMLHSPKVHRFIASSVSALLAANVMVLVVGLADAVSDPTEVPAELVVITNPDGTQTVVDPNTPEGWKAIDEANRRGDSVQQAPSSEAPTSTTATTEPGEQPVQQGEKSPVDDVRTTVSTIVDDVEELVDDTVRDVTERVDDTVDTITDIVDDNAGTDTGGLLDDEVDRTTDTVADTVDDVTDVVNETSDDAGDDAGGVVDDVGTNDSGSDGGSSVVEDTVEQVEDSVEDVTGDLGL